MLNKKLLEKVLTENRWGIYLKGKPLEEVPTNVGMIYKICEIQIDKLVDEYNLTLEKEQT